uniref:HAT C-terminal dimerisation domain-containing protein n=1 Tax=Sipha flava TaxID=143950 RepID=A0A2S2Q429_9HEMI
MISDLTKKKIAYDKIYNQFDFLFNLGNLKSDDNEKKAHHFQNIYCDDIEEDFIQEALKLSLIVNSIFPKSDESNHDKPNTQNLLTILRNKKLDSLFSNTEITLRLYYTLPISNCSGERSFSALKRVKSYFRSTLSKEKLN